MQRRFRFPRISKSLSPFVLLRAKFASRDNGGNSFQCCAAYTHRSGLAERLFDQRGRPEQHREFRPPETCEGAGEQADSASPRLLQEFFSPGGCRNPNPACILRVGFDFSQPGALESGDNPAHGWRLNLLGGGQLAESHGSAEYQNREGGKARRALTGENILLAGMAQQMDGGGVQAVGDLQPGSLLRARHTDSLAPYHLAWLTFFLYIFLDIFLVHFS